MLSGSLLTLPTAALAGAAWTNNGEVVVVDNDDEAIAASDEYAPEHLELMTQRNDYYQERLRNYGSLFVGEESTVAYGDKGVGTNHTLPTGKAARYTGGLWAGKFIKTVTYQRLTPQASRRIAPAMGRLVTWKECWGTRSPQTCGSAAIRSATQSRLQFLSAENQWENNPLSEEMQRDLSGCSGEKEWHLACDRPNFWSEHILRR